MPQYVVLQKTLKEKITGTSVRNLSELESVINTQASKGYRLHTVNTVSHDNSGLAKDEKIQVIMVFEKL